MNYLEVQARKQGGCANKHKETLNRTNYFEENLTKLHILLFKKYDY